MKNTKRALSLLLSLMLVLGAVSVGGISVSADSAEPVNTSHIMDEGTDITIDYYDDGTVYISGYGVLPTYTFDDDTSIKKIIFVEDCAVSKIKTSAFICLNSISALTDVEINSTVPLSIANNAFFYEGGTVNFTIKAPEIKSLSKGFITSYGANINVVFDTDEPLLLNPGVFSNMFIGNDSVFTVPYGSAVVEKIKYKFNDSQLQEEYSTLSNNGLEDLFWQEYETGLEEGRDYKKYYSAEFNDPELQFEYDMNSQDGFDYYFWGMHSDLAEGQDYVLITEEPEPVILTQENKSIIFGDNSYELIIKNSSGYEVEVISDVTLNIGDGTINSGNITEYTEGTETGLPTDITLEGYTFGGWYDNSDCEGTPVTAIPADATGPQEFWAKWTPNTYTVTWVDENGDELDTDYEVPYGTVPAYDGETPTKEPTDQHVFTFAGWSPEITGVTEDVTYTATFTQAPRKYEIKFVNDDGTELQSRQVIYGGTPAYTGEMPTKEATAQYTYSFLAWTPAIVPVTDDATYTATYTQAPREYEIKFVNEDGSELQKSDVAWGETPVYTGETPTKEQSNQYVYTFAGWSPEITGVTGEATYTATFTQAPRKYEIKFVNEDGTELQSSPVAWGETPKYTGETPAKAETDEATYTFKGWSPEITAAEGNATYTATFTETKKDKPADDKPAAKAAIAIKGEDALTLGYKQNKTFTADTEGVPEGGKVQWYLNGEKAGEGKTLKVENPEDDYTVQSKIVDASGSTVAESETVKVTVKHGFFDKLKAWLTDLLLGVFAPLFSKFEEVC